MEEWENIRDIYHINWCRILLSTVLPSLKNSKFAPENAWLEDDRFLLASPIFKWELLISGSVNLGMVANYCRNEGW